MRLYRKLLLVVWLWASPFHALAVSDAPLLALTAYIENAGNCSERLVHWNREYSKKTIAGETQRAFYYRVLGFMDWGPCGKPFFRPILGELQKTWNIFAAGLVSQVEFEAKERELINLLFAALKDDKRGQQMVWEYETGIAAKLIDLDPPRQYFNCTFFGDLLRCLE